MSKGLGRGLSSLITEKQDAKIANAASDLDKNLGDYNNLEVAIDNMSPGPFQPRNHFDEEELISLSESIKKNGVVQPILVRKYDANKYEIIAGERRWRASKMASLETVPAIVMDLDDNKALEIAIVENVQRQNLNILEEAAGYQRLIDEFSYTQEALSGVIGKSRSQIANILRLLSLPDDVQEWLNDDKISAGHARALLSAENPKQVGDEVIKKGLNVRQTEQLVKNFSKEPKRKKKAKEKDSEIENIESELIKKTGLNISIKGNNATGTVVVKYKDADEFNNIIELINSVS